MVASASWGGELAAGPQVVDLKFFGKVRVEKVHWATDHAVVFTAHDGKLLRYMYEYDECFPIETKKCDII